MLRAGSVGCRPTRIQLEVDQRRAAGCEGSGQRRFELVVVVDGESERAACLGDGGKVDGAEPGAQPRGVAAILLVSRDRAVAAVVEDDRQNVGTFPDGRFEIGHRHREPAVACQGHSQASGPGQSPADRRWQAVAHRAGRGTEKGAGAVEPETARRPGPKVTSVGGDDRFAWKEPGQGRNHAAGMDSRAVPLIGIHDGRRIVSQPICGVGCGPFVHRSGVENGSRENPLSHPQEGGHVGGHDDLGPMGRGGAERLQIHLSAACGGCGDLITERSHLPEPTAQDEQRVRLLQARPDTGRRPGTGHAQIQRVVVGKDITASPGRHDRNPQRLGEAHKGVGAAGPKYAGTGQNQRPAGIGDEMQDLAHNGRIGFGLMIAVNAGGSALEAGG